MRSKHLILIAVVIVAVAVALFVAKRVEAPTEDESATTTSAGIANPASVNCVQKLGGQIEIANEADGQVGYCHLPDGRVCEEWGLMRDNTCNSPEGATSSSQ